MNRKSIFGILLIMIVLALTLGAVNAEEVVKDASVDSILSADESEGFIQTEDSAGEINSISADLNMHVHPFSSIESENDIVWSILIRNNGPDVAHNTRVTVNGSDNLFFENPFNAPTYLGTKDSQTFYESQGIFDYHHFTWIIGDLQPDSYTELLVKSIKQESDQYYFEALVTSDSVDHDLSDNYYINYVGYQVTNSTQSDSVNETLPAEDNQLANTLPATCNPFIVLFLALMAIGVCGIKRKL